MSARVQVSGGTRGGPGVTNVRVMDEYDAVLKKEEIFHATPRQLRRAVRRAHKYANTYNELTKS